MLLLGLWTGGVAFFWLLRSRVGDVLPSVHLADALLRDVLARIDTFGLLAGPLLLLSLLAGWAPLQVPLRNRAVGVLIATALAAVSGRWLAPRRAELVAELGRRLEDVDPAAPRALELAQLEQVAVALLLGHGLIAAVLVVAAVRGSQPRRRFGIEV